MTYDSSAWDGQGHADRKELWIKLLLAGVNSIRGSPVRRVNDAEGMMIKGGMTDGEKTPEKSYSHPEEGRENGATHQHFSQRRRRTEMKGR